MVTLRIGDDSLALILDDCLGWTCLFLPPPATGVVAGLVLWFPWDLVLTTIFTAELLLPPSCDFSNFVQKSVSQSNSNEFDLGWFAFWTFCGDILKCYLQWKQTDSRLTLVEGLRPLSDWLLERNFVMIDDQFEKPQSDVATRQQDYFTLFS